MADRIELKGLECFGYHGVFDEERATGQPFVVDITLWVDSRAAAASDDVHDTVHYGEMAELAHGIVTGEPRNLIETVAAEVADAIMARFRPHAVEVTIHKPQAPIGLAFADVAVVARRSNR
ncbi:dihydroneopterin aldolase [Corynebacterium sp. 13CS0277]|uniref:dihydroneopterin aldolase n=1 Tax=Corynebacterium sp. 13CS0277 TaxID=2071994 RepID=UPI000D039E03|nr:dihydroneopterin aldolase [Corynebacterium sp. 13CS0277]PRQ11538.1 dihydroneopterin aldolase [Corynebacterium sp. 13CS0277]